MSARRSQSALARVATHVLRRLTHSEFGNVTARRADVQLVPPPGSAGNDATGKIAWMAGVDTLDDTTKVF